MAFKIPDTPEELARFHQLYKKLRQRQGQQAEQ